MKTLAALTLAFSASTFVLSSAHADSFKVSYLQPGIQSSSVSSNVETFNNIRLVNGVLTTNFNNSGITGTYSGGFALSAADGYGGANGTGSYITTGPYASSGNSYTLSLSQNVNYFGLWFSALDSGNSMSFYNGSNLLYSFTAANFLAAVGQCPGTAYCGNPNNGLDLNEQFAFINFYDATGSFNRIVFSQPSSPVAGFESDNHTVANLASGPGGTPVAVTPEPSSLILLGTGVLGVAVGVKRRFLGTGV